MKENKKKNSYELIGTLVLQAAGGEAGAAVAHAFHVYTDEIPCEHRGGAA